MTQPIELSEKQAEEFWARVNKTAACWIWDLERQENHWARLVSQAAALGTLPQAGPVWELAHQAAAATAATRSRLTQHRWNT